MARRSTAPPTQACGGQTMSEILVFGGAGYIGSHTCKALAEAGFQPVVFDNLSEGHREFVRWGELMEADIRDREAVKAAYERCRPVAAIHFAALAYVGQSVRDPEKYYQNNVSGSLHIIEAARQAGNVPLIFSSSCATYGLPDTLPITEDTVQKPISPYGRSKFMVEQILSDYEVAYGFPSVCLRYFNAGGSDLEGELGEWHREETHVIPRAILAALNRIDDFMIYGDDHDTPDGSQIRDFVHVADLANAHVRATSYLLQGGASACFNIGSGRGVSVFEVIAALSRITGLMVPSNIGKRRRGDPPVLVADPAKATAELDFQVQHSGLETILRTAFDWHQRHPLPKSLAG